MVGKGQDGDVADQASFFSKRSSINGWNLKDAFYGRKNIVWLISPVTTTITLFLFTGGVVRIVAVAKGSDNSIGQVNFWSVSPDRLNKTQQIAMLE